MTYRDCALPVRYTSSFRGPDNWRVHVVLTTAAKLTWLSRKCLIKYQVFFLYLSVLEVGDI